MEVLSLVASVAGLVSLAIEIPKLVDVAISIRSAPDEARKLSETADALVATLQRLEMFLRTDEASELNLANDSALTVSIAACQSRILDLSKKLRSQSSTPMNPNTSASKRLKTTVSRFRWPFDKKECLDIIAELHALQSTFEFCLILQNCRQMSKSHREVISHFKAQRETLSQMATALPDQVNHAKSMLDKLHVIESCVFRAAQNLDKIQIGIDELQEMKKDLAEYHSEKLHGEALEWLSPVDPSVRHDELRSTRLSGTCEWIRTHDAFQSWVQLPPSDDYSGVVCWVGNPGQGKTFTMSRIIDHLHELYPNDKDTYITYLYCDYQRTKSYSAIALVGALIRQLLSHFDTLPSQVTEIVRHARVRLRRANAKLDEMYRILRILQPQVKRLFVCVDALDEYNDAGDLLAACRRLPLQISFLFTGRHSISQTVKRAFPAVIHHTMEAQKRDIDAVISAKIEDDKQRFPELMTDWLLTEIRNEISALANGMFLLASLHTTLVLSYNTIYKRREALRVLPTSLEAAFGRTLERIREHVHASEAVRILAWVHSVGSLSLNELRHALAVESHHTQFEQDNLPSPVTVLDCCLGLVKIDISQPIYNDNQVTLVHSTLSVYFESDPTILGDIIPIIASACFTYLAFDPIERPRIILSLMTDWSIPLLQTLRDIPPKLEHAAWDYCIALNAWINENFSNSGGELFEILPRHARALAYHKNLARQAQQRSIGQSLFNTACMLGLDSLDAILRRLFEMVASETRESSIIAGTDSFGISSLGWVLLSKSHFDRHKGLGARPSKFDSFGHSLWRAQRLLQTTSLSGLNGDLWDLAALDIIRGSGATFQDGRRIDYFTSSPYLFFLGNYASSPEMIKRCISLMSSRFNLSIWAALRSSAMPSSTANQSANVSGQLWSFLFYNDEWPRSRKSSEEEDSSQRNPSRSTDTQMVPSSGQIADQTIQSRYSWLSRRVIALFEPGSDTPSLMVTDWQNDYYANYSSTRKDIIKPSTDLLSGVKCWSLLFPREALLHIGAAADSIIIVKYALFVCREDPNLRDPQGQTALQLSLRRRSGSTAMFLIQHPGTDLTILDPTQRSVLHLCAQHWRQDLLDPVPAILAKNVVNVDLQDRLGKTALHIAVETRSRQIIIMLLKSKADVNIEDNGRITALHTAIINRDAHICDLLLDPIYGATYTVTNLQAAWHLAIDAGAKFIMALLQVLKAKPQGLLTGPSQDSSPALVHHGRMLQLFYEADRTSTLTEVDLDFILKMLPTSKASASAETAVTTKGLNPLLAITDPPSTIRAAMVRGAGNVVLYLLRLFPLDLNHLGEDGESALHLAVIYNVPQVVHFLLGQKIDVSLRDPQGHTALQLALIYKRLLILEMLLGSQEVAVDETTKSGTTTLILAITHRFSEAVPLLLPHEGIPVNHLDGSGRTALHHAVMQQDTALVAELLRCPRMDVATLSSDGRTALAYAALCAGVEMVLLLLETGKFDPGNRDSFGKTALDWARLNPCKEVLKVLRNGT